MQTAADPHIRERPLYSEPLANRAKDGHLPVSPIDPAHWDLGPKT